jgi:hypothetical protein
MQKSKVIFTIEHEPRSLECTKYGSKAVTLRGKMKRTLRTGALRLMQNKLYHMGIRSKVSRQ